MASDPVCLAGSGKADTLPARTPDRTLDTPRLSEVSGKPENLARRK